MLTQHLLLELAVVLIVVHGCGLLCGLVGQPWVIGEVVAGIVLGPSVFGALLPGVSTTVFPASAMPALQSLGDLGLVLYMFTVGLRFDTDHLRRQGRRATVVSACGTLTPLALGAALAYFLFSSAGYAGPRASSRGEFMLLVGTAMAITAFPVLARILFERGLAGTQLGALALACAASSDILAWCLLALVVALASSAGASAVAPPFETVAFFACMLVFVRPALARAHQLVFSPRLRLVLIMATLWLAADTTSLIGVHPVFGAFMLGAVTPRSPAAVEQARSIDAVNTVTFLPLFFVASGLQTRLGLVDTPGLWLVCAAIILTAVSGKLVCCALAMRTMRADWREALALGALMNTRGLVELIVLNIGLADGLLTPRCFTMLVIMALVTTMMTAPFLSRLGYPALSRRD